LDDIFSASSAAIEILNDMLHYEHMDSGTFKLEMAVTPLLNVFAGRLEAYKFMALKKNISLRIEDQVQASEYYGGGDAGDGRVEDVEEGLIEAIPRNATVTDGSVSTVSVLYIDRFRVEQVIRNFMSNAIKFTPEGGNITMRIARVAAASTLAVGRPAKEKKYPIEQLEDDSVNKTITGFLRFEVVDSGAGSILCPAHHITSY
jgi:signal transduction histidine kinase